MTRDIKAVWELKRYGEICNICVVVLSALLACFFIFMFSDSNINPSELMGILVGVGVGSYFLINTFIKIIVMADEVPRGITFGMTRRKLFTYSRLFDLFEILLLTVLALIFVKVIDKSSIIKIAVLLYGFFMWLEGLAGNNVIRYGKIAYWVFYVIWFLSMFGAPRFIMQVPALKDMRMVLVDSIINPFYNQGLVWLGICAFVAVGMLINWLTFRKISANNNS